MIPFSFPPDYEPGALCAALAPWVKAERLQRIQSVINKRSRQVLVVFENTHHAHNISAILRTMEAFGFLDLFFLYSNDTLRFRPSDSVDRGASQWLFVRPAQDPQQLLAYLLKHQYQILPVSLPDFAITSSCYNEAVPTISCNQFQTACQTDKPLALIFGSELQGVSALWHQHAHGYAYVPLHGFTESLNVSVCAGILLQSLRHAGFCKPLEPYEKMFLEDIYLARTVERAYTLVQQSQPALLNSLEWIQAGRFLKGVEEPHA